MDARWPRKSTGKFCIFIRLMIERRCYFRSKFYRVIFFCSQLQQHSLFAGIRDTRLAGPCNETTGYTNHLQHATSLHVGYALPIEALRGYIDSNSECGRTGRCLTNKCKDRVVHDREYISTNTHCQYCSKSSKVGLVE